MPGADRDQRYANVQEVLDALNARERRRARRPLVLLGFVAPALLLAVMSVFAWSWFETAVNSSDDALRTRALDSNSFAAKYVAKTVTNELEIYYRAVEEMAASYRFQSPTGIDSPIIPRSPGCAAISMILKSTSQLANNCGPSS